MEDLPKLGIKAMKIGVLAAPDAEVSALKAVRKAIEAASAHVEVIGMDLAPVNGVVPDKTLTNTASVLYDAVYVVGGGDQTAALAEDDDAVRFIRDAYKHGKAVAACGNASQVVTKTLPPSEGDSGLVLSEKHADAAFADSFVEAVAAGRYWNRGPAKSPPSTAKKG